MRWEAPTVTEGLILTQSDAGNVQIAGGSARERNIMADDPQNETQDAPKSAADLRIEELIKRLDSMEESYKRQVADLTEANKGLWMELHKVPAESAPTPTVSQDPDPGEQALKDALGLK